MNSNSGGKKRQWFWAVVPAVVLLELVIEWRLPHSVPDDADWAAAAESIARQKKANDLVVIAPDWADQGREYLADLMSFKDFGRFDTTDYDRIFEVAAYGARAAETEGIEPVSSSKFGKVAVRTYELSRRTKVVYDFRDHLRSVAREGVGNLSPKFMIDRRFQPRYAIPVSLRKRRVVLTFKDVPLEGVLHGYHFLDYREARYNKGTAVVFRIFVEGKIFQSHHPKKPLHLHVVRVLCKRHPKGRPGYKFPPAGPVPSLLIPRVRQTWAALY